MLLFVFLPVFVTFDCGLNGESLLVFMISRLEDVQNRLLFTTFNYGLIGNTERCGYVHNMGCTTR